jgi:hypothetical protein
LYGIVGEVDERIAQVLKVEGLAAGPDVTITVPIGF